jgi:hypothetical protein
MLGHGDNMEATNWETTPRLEECDIAAWLELFDLLNVTLMSTGGPEAKRVFRGLGPRRHAHACRRLVRERQRLVVEIEKLGVGSIEERLGTKGTSSFCDSLDSDYVKLADAFVKCAVLATRMGNISLTQWLLDRARTHRQQALFLLT